MASASALMTLLIPSPISLVPLSATMSAKLPPGGTVISAKSRSGVLVRDVLHEEQREDVVLVLGRVHAAAQLVAALPERGVEVGFSEGHGGGGLGGLQWRVGLPAGE